MGGKGSLSRDNRPVKGASDKKRREKVQRNRLIKLGVAEEKVNTMNSLQVREMLKRPAKIKK